MYNNRESGIDIIGEIPWGTHIGHLYSSKADYADILIPFIKAGLLNNELCLWIYSQNMSYEQIKEIIGEFINDIDVFLESGQLKLISCLEWYMEDNSFNELRVNKKWNEFIRYALNNGFDGMRAVGDTSWLEKSYFRAFSNYEHNINKIISELPFIVICLYHVDKLDTYEIATIIKNHSYVITRHNNDLQIINNIELLIKDKQLKESEERIDVTPFMKIRELEKDIEKNRELLNNTLEYDQIKTEFFSNISHELKTPLNVILATIQLLKCRRHLATDTYIKESKYLKIMQQNCFRLLRLVNNIIDITKIDSDYFEMKLQNYDIIGLIKRITMSVVEYAKNKGITILFDTNKEAKTVACDPDQIERIILNLLSNAIKFTCRGGNIWVSVIVHGEKLEIIVEDNGIGIPINKQKTIFNRFQQVDKSLTRQHEGSGIGLSIVKGLVEKHNGRITVDSEVGKGSKFTIEIPCKTLTEAESKQSLKYNVNDSNCVEKINIEFSDIYS